MMMNSQKSFSDESSFASQANEDFANLVHVGSYYDQKRCQIQGSAQRSQQKTKTSIDVSDSVPELGANIVTKPKMTFPLRYAVDMKDDERDTGSQQIWEAERRDLDWEDIYKKLAEMPRSSKVSDRPIISSSSYNIYSLRRGNEFDMAGSKRDGQKWASSSRAGEMSETGDFYPPSLTGQYSSPVTSKDYNQILGGGMLYDGWGLNEPYVDYVTNESLYSVKKLPGSCRSTEADYLFSDELVKKRKFRLMINPVLESKLKAEFPCHSHDLEVMIKEKYQSLGVPVEVKAYRRQDKNVDKTTNTKAFNLIFNSYRDVERALELTKNGQLDFTMKEARPSPNYLVKYMVMYTIEVYEGKCFSKQIGEMKLQKGDIVTANQLKGNKLRIIRYCAAGTDYEQELCGWVLLQTKEMELLRRVTYVDGQPIMTEDRPHFETIIPKEQQTTESHKTVHKTNPQRVSAARCSPFKVLADVEVCKGRKEPTVVGRLKPNQIVWANQHKGSMLRIVKMERGDIKLDNDSKPEIWGWVSLRRKGEEPRLERMTHTPFKTNVKIERRKSNPDIHRSRSFQSCDMASSFASSRGYDHSFPVLPRRGGMNREPHSNTVSTRTQGLSKREELALIAKQTSSMGSPSSLSAMSES